jgi:hypothetical protein
VRAAHELAQKLGKKLGPGQILQRPVPCGRAPEHVMNMPTRCLVLVLGDQLWMDNPALADFDPLHKTAC